MDEKKAIINTFHASVANYLNKLDPEQIIAFDNRFELSLVEDDYYQVIEKLPFTLAQAFLSPKIHLLMGRFADTHLCISEDCLKSKISYLSTKFGLPLTEEDITNNEQKVNKYFGTKFNFLKPRERKNLSNLINKETFIDLGISSIKEYKEESLFESNCSSPINEEEFWDILSKSNPQKLFISNIKSINKIKKFLNKLNEKGYKIEKDKVVNEKEAQKAKELYKDFTQYHLNKIKEEKEYKKDFRTSDLKSWLIDKNPSEKFIEK